MMSKYSKVSKAVRMNFSRQLHASNAACKSFASQPDASSSSVTGKFIDDVTKPYTVTTYARPNLVIARGKGSYLYDLEDREYVDFTAGIAVTCLGHSNEEVSKIIAKQSQTLMHCSNLYYNLPAGELANKLVAKTVDAGGMSDAQRVFLCNSGTEANEAALKFARKYAKSKSEEKIEIIAFENAFHGRTMGALSVTANPKYQKPFAPLIPGVHTASTNDIETVKKVISKEKTAAVIIEPIQGEGGVNAVDETFLVELKKLCDENDVVLIYDEIQCGLGRTGQLWAHCNLPKEAHPDILTMAKALGNGFPIGAVMISEKIENALEVGDHGTTYGGNPLAASVGSYVVDQVSDAEFLKQVQATGDKFVKSLSAIAEKYPEHIEKVKGRGLLLGLQFKPETDINAIVLKCREYGLLVITAGGNVIRLVPALNIPDEATSKGIEILERAISEVVV
ncbi:CIC11C00000000144 [Sungouiella intermedia]|uniref:Acetylornithine aminotransferase, mitochondrial n=1 Tax=Sungouiella intermedia TaxID=45354 RepID=A0A1L0DTS2_9ASCO|nr:CIC11C00000000144 [[Candida] intermedia]